MATSTFLARGLRASPARSVPPLSRFTDPREPVYSLAETRQRLANIAGAGEPQATLWEEQGEAWVAIPDPVSTATVSGPLSREALLRRRATIDAVPGSVVEP